MLLPNKFCSFITLNSLHLERNKSEFVLNICVILLISTYIMLTKRQLFELVQKTYPCTKGTVVDNRQSYREAVLSCLSKHFPSAPDHPSAKVLITLRS